MARGYVTQSSDTDEAAERVQFQIYASWSMQQKLEVMTRLCEEARELTMIGLRLRYPSATQEELKLREAGVRLGDELARKVYGERYTALGP